jgi:cold shock CspA family protein
MNDTIYKGRCKKFLDGMGYFFITPNDNEMFEGKDVFSHTSKLIGRSPRKNDLLKFKVEKGSRGYRATWCKCVDDEQIEEIGNE